MAGFHSAPSRIRALEKALRPTGALVIVEGPDVTPDDREANAKRRAAAEAAGRPVVYVSIGFSDRRVVAPSQSVPTPPPAARPPDSEE